MNRLQHETSPYLLQHADNPVDWYPWGEEALQKARAEDKPILLSVGYSACHWCHVMAHESFEDDATAEIMNDLFVNIKVDREERPDLDDIYMRATQIFQQGRGGWPMTVFLTPDARPFHAGTYYPPQPRHGMPSFTEVMQAVSDAYNTRRDEVEQSAAQVAEMLQNDAIASATGLVNAGESEFDTAFLEAAAEKLSARPDMIYGGLHTGQPKFPGPMNLDFLLRHSTVSDDKRFANLVGFTLERMARGGIYDQLGGGFARYSVDNRWLVPHFEKMLYDNAQLARVYIHAFQAMGDDYFARIAHEILDYVAREMRDDNGGFYSTQDADSEGEEGKFYVWRADEVRAALRTATGMDETTIQAILDVFGVTPGGNWEGKSILTLAEWPADVAPRYDLPVENFEAQVAQARQVLYAKRAERVWPGRDEKMLAAWNGMMLAAYAEAARVFPAKRETYTAIARANAEFILGPLSQEDGRLYRSHKDGISKINAYLEDYAGVIDGLLELYQTTFETRWFSEARRLADHVLAHFGHEGGGFYDTSDDHEQLVARPRNLQDNATPSGNTQMAYNLLRLTAYTGDARYEEAVLPVYRSLREAMAQYPSAFGLGLSGLFLLVHRPVEVAVVGAWDAAQPLLDVAQREQFQPRVVSAWAGENQGDVATPELLAYRMMRGDVPTVYVCQNFTCAMPVTVAEDVARLLDEA